MQTDDLPIIRYPSRARLLGYLLGNAAFVAIGIWMGTRGKPIGYVCATFFGLGLLVTALQMLPSAGYLALTDDGFEYKAMFRKTTVAWPEITDIRLFTIKQTGMTVSKLVGFNFDPKYTQRSKAKKLSHALSGCDGCLPENYGYEPEELANLMWQLKCSWHEANRLPLLNDD